MAKKPIPSSEEDPIVKRFISGLKASEHPFAPTPVREAVRTRGVPVRGGRVPSFVLEEDDAIVQQFREGLEIWERPFRKASPE